MSSPSIEAVLREHRLVGADVWTCECACGYRGDTDHNAHLADAIRAHLAEHTDEAAGAVERGGVRCPDVKAQVPHEPHWHAVRGGNITFAQGQCAGYRAALAGGASGAAEEKE